MSEKPFEVGESVVLVGVGKCRVHQCFDAAGGWRVVAKGPWSRANVHGLYDFPAEKVVKADA